MPLRLGKDLKMGNRQFVNRAEVMWKNPDRFGRAAQVDPRFSQLNPRLVSVLETKI